MTEREIRKHHLAAHQNAATLVIDECPKCKADQAACERKRQFGHWADADLVVRRINELGDYKRPITRYRCRWCDLWHLTSRMNRSRARRVERMRRKWVTERELARRRRPALMAP